jgi:hypothetical protein
MKKVLLLLLIVLLPVFAFAETKEVKDLFVFSKKAKVMKEANMKSKIVKKLEKGDKLELIEKNGMWYKIKSEKAIGWVNKYQVTEEDPSKTKTAVEVMKINLKKNSRKRASAYATAASARGLSDDEVTSKDIKVDIEAVKKMEENKPSEKKVKKFIKEGNLE